MSFTTRCPACGTMFRVVADQLKISDGWVRCGHCSDVFDATIHLEAWVPPHTAKAPPAPPPVSPPAVGVAMATGTDAPQTAPEASEARAPDDDLTAWFGDEPLPPPPAVAAEAVAPPAAAAAAPAVDPDFHSELQQFASAQGRSLASAPAPLADVPALVARSAGDPPEAPAEVAPPAAARGPAAVAPEPGFVRQARRRAFWTSPGMQRSLAVMTLLLAVLLGAQWALQERHRLVVSQPALKPWIEQACGWLGCSFEPLRRIDAVVIDSSALVRRLGNFYSFDFVLKNTANVDVAVPALELSLTDGSDAVIARRVFLPQDWPNAPTVLPATGSLTVSLRLSLTLGESTPMAGYRALVFHP